MYTYIVVVLHALSMRLGPFAVTIQSERTTKSSDSHGLALTITTELGKEAKREHKRQKKEEAQASAKEVRAVSTRG